jgi:hypothetical protein
MAGGAADTDGVGSGTPDSGGKSGWDSDDRFADLPPIEVTVPDDLSELDEEVQAYQREQEARQQRLTGRPGRAAAGGWLRSGRSGPVSAAILLAMALVGALASLLAPSRDSPPRPPSPLATHATAAPGQAGALLPAGQVRVDGEPVDLRSVRPGVFALVTPACNCRREVDQLVRAAAQYRLQVLLVPTAAGDSGDFRELIARVARGSAQPAEDTDAALRTAYAPRELTVILVRADGVVSAVHRGLRQPQRLELDLARLAHPEITR